MAGKDSRSRKASRTPVRTLPPIVSIIMGSKSDWETMRRPASSDRVRRAPRDADRFRAPHARADGRIRHRCGRAGHRGDHRRCGRRGSSPGMTAPTLRFRCSAYPSRARRLKGSIRCFRSCRCRPVSRWQRWRSGGGREERRAAGDRDPRRQARVVCDEKLKEFREQQKRKVLEEPLA